MSTPSDRTGRPPRSEAPREAAAKRVDRIEKKSASLRPGGPQSLVGVVLSGRYLIERLIGEGGMGAVYQAEHTHMRKRLAVKVLHPEMSRLPEVVARFEREAMAAAHIEHPNVAAATDFGKLDDGSFFLVLEYVEGQSLRDVVAAGPLELSRALHIARQMASALGRAHAIGIVHRDLKPENVMLVARDGEADFVKILDFGIAKVPVGELGSDPRGHGEGPRPVLTQLGMVYGTPEYMAPEQALGEPVDARADLYSLGVMLFEMLAGARPYEHESKVTLLGMHVTAPIPHLRARAEAADIPQEVDALVFRLLAKEASARFAGAKELVDALDLVVSDLTARGRIAAAPHALAPGPRASSPRLISDLGRGTGAPFAPTRLADPVVVSSSFTRRTAASSGLFALLIVLAIALFLWRGSAHRPSDPPGAPTTPEPSSRAPDRKTDDLIAAAQSNIERGDYATAIASLTSVEKTRPDRPDVHLLLERAYTGVRNARDAMREAALLLDLDPTAETDLKLQENVRNAALIKETQEDAFAILESEMGPRGIDILYDVAYGASGRLYPQAAARAKKSLASEGVRGRASPALLLLLEFREAKGCESKRGLLERARDQGDARLLPTLAQMQARSGCGFLGSSDCFGCMRHDGLLTQATTAVEERAAKSP